MHRVMEAKDHKAVIVDVGQLLFVDRVVLEQICTVAVVIEGGLVPEDEVLALRHRGTQHSHRG